jgi:NADH:ubiquinone reductase (H+-translocating)
MSADDTTGVALHRIVVVGGGAAGLELVTQLGDRLGRRSPASVTLVECARTHLWKPLLHAVAAGSIDPGEYEVNYLAQAHWHAFRYRFGEMIGLDRTRFASPPRSTTRGARSLRRAPSNTIRW